MIKPKRKPCKECGVKQYKRTYGLGHNCRCYQKWLITTPEGREKVKRSTLKATAPRKELERAEIRIKSERAIPAALASTKAAVHGYVQARDKGKPCISCGTPYKEDFHAGHMFKAELYSTVRFDFLNINGQCQYCNLRMDGNVAEYMLRLPQRIGQEKFDMLLKRAKQDKKVAHKWDLEILKTIRKRANQLKRELKSK